MWLFGPVPPPCGSQSHRLGPGEGGGRKIEEEEEEEEEKKEEKEKKEEEEEEEEEKKKEESEVRPIQSPSVQYEAMKCYEPMSRTVPHAHSCSLQNWNGNRTE